MLRSTLLAILAFLSMSCSGPDHDRRGAHVVVIPDPPSAHVDATSDPEPVPPKPLVLPGNCVPVPVSGGYGSAAGEGFDLDGDGTDDKAVFGPIGRMMTSVMSLSLYVVRGDCGHLVGTVMGRIKRSRDHRRNGLAKLIVHTCFVAEACPPELWSFNGERYEKERELPTQAQPQRAVP